MFYYSHIWITSLPPDIIKTNVLTKFHDDRTINVTFRVLVKITAKNLLTRFHDDPTINVTSRVFTRFNNGTINVASRVFTRRMWTRHNERRTQGNHKSSP
ncbi:hypothetical protein DPMN_095872 [Dreissena polymorpha]|uniref:Uncharacterized protein n=1 Tax=Dreissena polymorpha TaxID=45954 RepID=A0A9D4R4X9_DREPO|nr:hypothetical protein DPMN_095872 [Dreissena polymorpha]